MIVPNPPPIPAESETPGAQFSNLCLNKLPPPTAAAPRGESDASSTLRTPGSVSHSRGPGTESGVGSWLYYLLALWPRAGSFTSVYLCW